MIRDCHCRMESLPIRMNSSSFLLAAALLTAVLPCQAQINHPIALADSGPVTIAHSSTFDFTSAINGRAYRVLVSVPPGFDKGKRYGVLYVLDGNQYFGTASEAVARQSFLKTIRPVIVVGIGYPSSDFAVANRERWFDLTHQPSELPEIKFRTGGGKQFEEVVLDEVRPFVDAQFPVETRSEAIWGQSLGGLFALQLLLDRPEAFAGYVLSSPSIWWNNKVALTGLEALPAKLARAGQSRIKVLVTSARDEQRRATSPDFVYEPSNAMVDDAAELSIRLARISPEKLAVSRVVFDGEVHNTVSPASISRTLRFLFPIAPAEAR
jgi:uncharacterized protein